ncbi:hypothetical protein L4D09_08240 [Photobacterium makurazakiensis]|uniref:hypothetical protein n=1 Tax=Photobacterium makurazakiensis TaxID=2910234 RepID=UPI003D0B32C3
MPDKVRFRSGQPNQLVVGGEKIQLTSPRPYSDRFVPITKDLATEIPHYLDNFQPYMASWGKVKANHTLLAFSYGEGHEVNRLIALKICQLLNKYPIGTVLVQWEIANLISTVQPALNPFIKPVTLDEGQAYMSTIEVARKAMAMTTNHDVTIVAQSWHLSRCIRHAEIVGWRCQAARSLDSFAPNDPQPWVRHPLDWIIKESKMRYLETQQSNIPKSNVSRNHATNAY